MDLIGRNVPLEIECPDVREPTPAARAPTTPTQPRLPVASPTTRATTRPRPCRRPTRSTRPATRLDGAGLFLTILAVGSLATLVVTLGGRRRSMARVEVEETDSDDDRPVARRRPAPPRSRPGPSGPRPLSLPGRALGGAASTPSSAAEPRPPARSVPGVGTGRRAASPLTVVDLHADSLLWGRDLRRRATTRARSTSHDSSRAASRLVGLAASTQVPLARTWIATTTGPTMSRCSPSAALATRDLEQPPRPSPATSRCASARWPPTRPAGLTSIETRRDLEAYLARGR